MDGVLTLCQSSPPAGPAPDLRLETGAVQPTQATPWQQNLPTWAMPAASGVLVFLGISIAAAGFMWLRKRPARDASPDELFERVAKALGVTAEQRAVVVAQAAKVGPAGVPSATGLLVWPRAK